MCSDPQKCVDLCQELPETNRRVLFFVCKFLRGFTDPEVVVSGGCTVLFDVVHVTPSQSHCVVSHLSACVHVFALSLFPALVVLSCPFSLFALRLLLLMGVSCRVPVRVP